MSGKTLVVELIIRGEGGFKKFKQNCIVITMTMRMSVRVVGDVIW